MESYFPVPPPIPPHWYVHKILTDDMILTLILLHKCPHVMGIILVGEARNGNVRQCMWWQAVPSSEDDQSKVLKYHLYWRWGSLTIPGFPTFHAVNILNTCHDTNPTYQHRLRLVLTFPYFYLWMAGGKSWVLFPMWQKKLCHIYASVGMPRRGGGGWVILGILMKDISTPMGILTLP